MLHHTLKEAFKPLYMELICMQNWWWRSRCSWNGNIKVYIYIHTRLLVWKIGENEDKLLLDEDLWERFGWTTATKVTTWDEFNSKISMAATTKVMPNSEKNQFTDKIQQFFLFQVQFCPSGQKLMVRTFVVNINFSPFPLIASHALLAP